MSGHLTPQVRVDRNGRAVIRHVRNDAEAMASKRSFPVPVMPPADDLHADRLQKVLDNVSTSAGVHELPEEIRRADDDSLLLLLERVSSGLGPEEKSYRKALRAILKMTAPGSVEKHLRAVSVLKGSIRPDLMLRFIAGMEKTESLQPYANRLDAAPESIRQEARVRAQAVEVLVREGYGVAPGKQFYIRDRKLEAAILKHPDRTEEYARFAAERGSAEALNEIDSAHSAFRGGLL